MCKKFYTLLLRKCSLTNLILKQKYKCEIMNSKQILGEIHTTNNHSKSTRETYEKAVKLYCSHNDMELFELLQEAEEEENKGVKWKLSSLKRRLISYRHFLLENFSYNTFRTYFSPIINIYKFFDIEIYDLPNLNHKAIKKSKPINFRDLPDKEIIREAVNMSSPLIKAVILFMCSSGCALQETVNLTVNDYLQSIGDYTKKRNVYEAINEIRSRDDIVPTWDIWRQKTNKYYTTYSSPESVIAINSYLLTREDKVTGSSRLFQYNKNYIQQRFIRINNELNLGTVGDYNYGRFRSHMLRKFHASALYNDGMSLDKVNDLQGKAKNKTDQAYFMTNPEDLKYEYISHLPAVTINEEVKKLSIKSPEFIQMENDKRKLETELDSIRQELNDIRSMKGDLESLKAKVGK